MKIKFLSIVLLSLISTYWFGCTANNKQQTNDNQNTESGAPKQQIAVEVERFDKAVFDYVQAPTAAKEHDLKTKYGNFLEAFGSTVFNYSDTANPLFFEKLRTYFSNNMLLQIYSDEQKKFSDLQPYINELAEANYIISQNFEQKTLPVLALHVSGFKENIIATDTILSISADKYLGADYNLYQNFFEKYQIDQMQTSMLTRDLLKAWLIYEMPKTNERKTLLSEMIDNGKILFALEELLPNWKDSDLIGYTQDQIDWSYTNEKNNWQKMIQQNHLYSNDHLIINKYNADGPYTPTVSPDSPGALGKWIGWQIVRAYAKNTGASLEAILANTNAQNILKVSKYNPQ